jgi:MATE family, multidrug efflux pump
MSVQAVVAPPARPAPVPAPAVLSSRTRTLLQAPILPTLLRLAAPNIAVMVLQSVGTTAEPYFVGSLGSAALAGVVLVYPLVMLMLTMSAGGLGGGVASAVARALGAGRREQANALVAHAVVIALAMAALFTLALLLGGPALYRAMGGEGAALEAAVVYSNVVFSLALAPWLLNILASVVRGTGQMMLPAGLVLVNTVLLLTLSPALIFGWGPFPALGVAGAGLGTVVPSGLGALVLLGYLCSGRGLVRLPLVGLRLRWALFWEILRVGAPGALNTVFTNLTAVLLTSLVGPFGTLAVAGYGVGSRLEYLQIPLVFGLGSALVTMVGTNVGAGQIARARRVAWIGAGLAGGASGVIGLTAALFPLAWVGLFSGDAEVLATGVRYLRTVGPFYGFFGGGLALYFASQGAGRLLWPLVAGSMRLVAAAIGGWLAIHWLGGGLAGLFGAIAVAMVVFGSSMVVLVRRGSWR